MRLYRIGRFERGVFAEIGADRRATWQGLGIVVVASLAGGWHFLWKDGDWASPTGCSTKEERRSPPRSRQRSCSGPSHGSRAGAARSSRSGAESHLRFRRSS
jgi:hypothetical protein